MFKYLKINSYNNHENIIKLTALSPEERKLFKDLVLLVDRKIKPGLTKLTWNSEYIDTYIKDCCTHTADVSFLCIQYSIIMYLLICKDRLIQLNVTDDISYKILSTLSKSQIMRS